MVDIVLLHQAKTFLQVALRGNGNQTSRHDFLDLGPRGAAMLCCDLVGNIALRDHAYRTSFAVANRCGADLAIPEIIRSLVHRSLFGERINILADAEQLFHCRHYALHSAVTPSGWRPGSRSRTLW